MLWRVGSGCSTGDEVILPSAIAIVASALLRVAAYRPKRWIMKKSWRRVLRKRVSMANPLVLKS